MNYRVERTLLALTVALVCALGLLSVARAQDSNAVATTLTIAPPDPVASGTPVTIRAQLHTASNQKQGAVGNETIDLSVDGVHQRSSKTDANGVATSRDGTTTRTSLGLGSASKEMHAVCPAIVLKPAGRVGSVQDAHSALVVP